MLSSGLGIPAQDQMVRRGARDIVYAQLRQLIVSGELEPGACIAEKALAARVGMSRTPLRESIKALETQGFMTRLPNGRLMVASLSPRGLRDLYATRLAIERLIVQSVVSEATDGQIQETLDPIAASIRSAVEVAHPEARAFGERFHYALAEICPNRVASTILWELKDRIALYRKIGPDRSPGRRMQAAKDHLRIYELVRARQASEAVELLEEHIRRSQEVTLGFIADTPLSSGETSHQPSGPTSL
ncbi:MAG: GntR family transcriptional regulator [Chloroflexi bacterium]|nr:GntR family transcriptional regulator [Chloroflexota bacterium]